MRRPLFTTVLCFVLAVGAAGCALDYLGWEELVSSSQLHEQKVAIEDDRIEDKNPVYIDGMVVEEQFGECVVGMNKSRSVTMLSLPEMDESESVLTEGLFRGRAEAIEAVGQYGSAPLIPSLESVFGTTKPFNDGLYAGIEWNLQFGVGEWAGKRAFLLDLDQALVALESSCHGVGCNYVTAARIHVLSGLKLGGATVIIPPELADDVDDAVNAFLANPLFASPMGFYNWSQGLEEIFMQDRFFQNYAGEMSGFGPAEMGRFVAIAVALRSDEKLAEDYSSILGLYEVLTNPYAHFSPRGLLPYVHGPEALDDLTTIVDAFATDHADLGSPCGPRFALFPSSKSKETEMYEEFYCNTSPPSDVTIIDVFINQIRSGAIDLAPADDSGWYDYQTYALETLLVPENAPESDHLMLTAAYKKKLIDTFKSIMTQNRETHIKQVDIAIGMGAAAEPVKVDVDIYPKFVAEPFPTFYLRTARAYRFLDAALTLRLGEEFLNATGRYRDSAIMDETSLSESIRAQARLLYGLYLLNCHSLGMQPELLADELSLFPEPDCVAEAAAWLAEWKSNEDVLTDPRVIVPVALDAASGKAVFWAIIGVRVLKAEAAFHVDYQPEVLSLTAAANENVACEFRSFVPQRYHLLTEKQVEVRLSAAATPPTRDELRTLCDKYMTEDAIVEALESWGN